LAQDQKSGGPSSETGGNRGLGEKAVGTRPTLEVKIQAAFQLDES
jgi:hypothetical protein